MNHDEKNGFLRENFTFIMSGVIFLMSKPEFRVSKTKRIMLHLAQFVCTKYKQK
jgi:hypothetical protein